MLPRRDGGLTEGRGLGNNVDNGDKSDKQSGNADGSGNSQLSRGEFGLANPNIQGIESSKHGADSLPVRAERAEEVLV